MSETHGMCTVVLLRRPGHRWPLLLAANRDEMADRPWRPPGRHWPDRESVVAGLDELAGGTWLGLNDFGVVAAILNRIHTLGPAQGKRSRGELPLEALDHGDAAGAAAALGHLAPEAYRPFNMVVADRRDAFWIRAAPAGNGAGGGGVDVIEVPPGLSMITAFDRNDERSPRIGRYLPLFRQAAAPDPGAGDWSAWESLLADRGHDEAAGPGGAMTVTTDTGFGTVSSALIALPAGVGGDASPLWRFAAGPPDRASYEPVSLAP